MQPPPSWFTKYLSDILKKFPAPRGFKGYGNVPYMEPTLFTDHEQFVIPVDLAKCIVSQHVVSASKREGR